jgi:polyhydroxyalkanoate synthesis regulator phasin
MAENKDATIRRLKKKCAAYHKVVLSMQPLVKTGIMNMGEDAKTYVDHLNKRLKVLEKLLHSNVKRSSKRS